MEARAMSNPQASDRWHERAAAHHWVGSRVLLVSDEPASGRIWAFALQQMGLEAALVSTSREALDRWAVGGFDMLIIDVHTPQLDGIDLCRQVRAEAVSPILLFSPRGDEAHILEAYQAGVDECVTKPVSPALFLAKARAWLRRSWTVSAGTLDCLQVDALRLDPARREIVAADGLTVKLSALEFRLLYLLMNHRGQVLYSDLIIDRVWGYAGGGDHTLLKNLVYRLRRKIEPDPHLPCYIQTVAGEGYSFLPR
jgi:two-component system response regulator RegX3